MVESARARDGSGILAMMALSASWQTEAAFSPPPACLLALCASEQDIADSAKGAQKKSIKII